MMPVFLRRSMMVAAAIATLLPLHATAQDSAARGRKFRPPPPVAHIEILVTRASSGKPIENAAVVFHTYQGDKGNMELKTNDEGKAIIDVLPIGSTAQLQILANGFQTYGEDFKVDKDQMTIAVKLERPVGQYSIYTNGDIKGKNVTGTVTNTDGAQQPK